MIFLLGIAFITALSLKKSQSASSKTAKTVLHFVFIIASAVLMTHSVPYWENLLLFKDVKFAADSYPFTLYLNFDKPLVGIIILFVLGFGAKNVSLKRIFATAILMAVLVVVTLLGPALLSGYVRWDPKLPSETLIWALNNLLFVCVAEEAFFRRYLLGGLKNKIGFWPALFFTSVCFGVAHYAGGLIYVGLSTVAGLFYGWSYLKSGRLESAILTHFLLNFTHFLFFSYPALQKSF